MKKNIIYIIIILLATLDIFTNYNIVTKFSLLFLCLLILFLSIKNKIPKTFPKIVYLLVFYFITYFLFKFFRYNLVYAVKSIFILIKIFAFPLLIYFICQNKDKDNQKSSFIFLLILSLIMIIKMIISHTLNLEELILILSCLLLIYPAKEWLKYIIIIITISLSLIFKNNLLLLYAAILIITSIYFHMRNHQTRKGIVILSILLIFSLSSFLFLHTPSLENKTNYVINDYEFPIHPYEVTNINTYNDFISSFKTTDIKDITWGYNYHFINLSDSIITVFLHLGILGFLLYISLYYYLLKKLHILNNPYIISIIIFCFMTNIIYLPIMALIIGLCLRQEDVKEEEYATIFTLKKLLLLIGIIVLSFLLPFLIKSSTSNIIVDLELQNTLKVLNDYELDLAEENH